MVSPESEAFATDVAASHLADKLAAGKSVGPFLVVEITAPDESGTQLRFKVLQSADGVLYGSVRAQRLFANPDPGRRWATVEERIAAWRPIQDALVAEIMAKFPSGKTIADRALKQVLGESPREIV